MIFVDDISLKRDFGFMIHDIKFDTSLHPGVSAKVVDYTKAL